MQIDLTRRDTFERRHNGPWTKEHVLSTLLQSVGSGSMDQLIDETVPEHLRVERALDLPEPKTEYEYLNGLRNLAAKNKVFHAYIGMGYYGTIVPPVIQRNILENPGWYTAYTPYQAEIAQGRLEALVNFQTMVADLTGMDLANASLLDEGTAAAEAMAMIAALRKGDKKDATVFYVDENAFPQTVDVIRTRAEPLNVEVKLGDVDQFDLQDPHAFGLFVQYPGGDGALSDPEGVIRRAHDNGLLVCVAADLLALTLIKSPGMMGADVVVGTTQRFGVPMGYGGPHAAYFATLEQYKRQIPGRIIGVSVDRDGQKAYRMALQTREQHIRREKATSNICTAQVLLAVMAGMYAVYHGPEGLRAIALRVHGHARLLSDMLQKLGYVQRNKHFFDTLRVKAGIEAAGRIRAVAEEHQMNFRYFVDGDIGISLDETHDRQHIAGILHVFAEAAGKPADTENIPDAVQASLPDSLHREQDYLTHPVFNAYRSEHEMLRYIKRLENKDLSLAHSMISLGSCTMKLNATAEMIPLSWPEFAHVHPFAPLNQVAGYLEIFAQLENWLNEITGFAGTSFQPNSGAQGEFTGLMLIRAYNQDRGQGHRNVALIPSSAHGTNPASAIMAGMRVVIVQCDDRGNIDMEDLKKKAFEHRESLAALMVTYPSTHGVYEEGIVDICKTIHAHGGQVYMDGANMNAQVGLTSPARIGADVCHLNLHKTFSIPHGGGGPGVGPVCAARHLVPFMPGHAVIQTGGDKAIGAVSSAPFGSASILTISHAYIAMMGAEGLTNATKLSILNANYILSKLKAHYKILYTGKYGRSAHEFIIDCRGFRNAGIEVEDIAKRLMDYGFHAPTVSFPVPGTMMIEPTESEEIGELDRFCEAMISIRGEIDEVISGKADAENNVLKNAPHTNAIVTADRWDLPYSREKAAFPVAYLHERKFWPSVRRVDNAYGDRHLFCSCIPVEEAEALQEV